jgi:hypothetical protein
MYRSAASPAPVVGVSLGHRELSEADHWILALDPPPVLACTHLVRAPFPHVAISLVGAGPVSSPAELRGAADLAVAGRSGRAVVFPGVEHLTGALTVAAVLAASAIDEIRVLGGEHPDPSTVLETGDFVRPQFQAGRLILTAMPAAGGRLVPFESRHPTPCCAAH